MPVTWLSLSLIAMPLAELAAVIVSLPLTTAAVALAPSAALIAVTTAPTVVAPSAPRSRSSGLPTMAPLASTTAMRTVPVAAKASPELTVRVPVRLLGAGKLTPVL